MAFSGQMFVNLRVSVSVCIHVCVYVGYLCVRERDRVKYFIAAYPQHVQQTPPINLPSCISCGHARRAPRDGSVMGNCGVAVIQGVCVCVF